MVGRAFDRDAMRSIAGCRGRNLIFAALHASSQNDSFYLTAFVYPVYDIASGANSWPYAGCSIYPLDRTLVV